MKPILAAIILLVFCNGAYADTCADSRDYLLGSYAGDLPQAPESYQKLFKICSQTSQMSNVEKAFVLKDGSVGILPKRDTLSATAVTLSRFCERFPGGTLRFIKRSEFDRAVTVGRVAQMSSNSATPCRKILTGGL